MDTIGPCLDALKHQTIPRETYEVIVVDDGSSDGTRARVETHDGVRFFAQPRSGPAVARNLGLRHARGELVLFTDADCEPTPDWIEQMINPFYDKQVIGVKGVYLTRQRAVIARFVQLEYEDRYDYMARQTSIDFIDTYAAGYRRDVLLAHGGFDPSFPVASVEDQELSFRLAEQGYRLIFIPQAKVYHLDHARTLWAYVQRKFRIGYWKVRVTRRYPGKLLHDSHTPHVLKIQILLVALGLLCLLGYLLWPPLGWGLLISVFSFLVTTLPFVIKAWPRDPQVAVLASPLLLVRALALGIGFAVGLIANWGPSVAPSTAPAAEEDRD
jgi:GT2 family glycosyltransferase